MRLKTLAVLAVVGLSLPGCHTATPTSGIGINIKITAGIANSAGQATLLEAQLLADTTVLIQDNPSPTPAASLSLNSSGVITTGPHTLSFLVANQTTSPNNYIVTAPVIQVYDAAGNYLRTMTLTTQSSSLTTGSAINYSITL